ncbi:MAG TPA: hypothetical protein VMT55_01820 [Candidatus Sulfotelmatobacter sp.]|nr:hypothetical protein [Candidatus Sulfotelmatobacter sp.]
MNPSLADVLASGSAAAVSINNFLYLTTALALGVCAALAAKSYTLSKRCRFLAPIVDESHSLARLEREKVEKLEFMLGEAGREKELLAGQNNELREQLNAYNDLKQAYEVLYRSNLALAREAEKMRIEKAGSAVPAALKPAKAKEVKRKPRRVSKKTR